MVVAAWRGHVGAGCCERGFRAANYSARRIAIQPAAAATPAAAQDRGAGGAADGCAAAPADRSVWVAPLVRRPDQRLSRRGRRGRNPPEPSRSLFTRLRQQVIEAGSISVLSEKHA